LPDLFSSELGAPIPGSVSVVTALKALSDIHARLVNRAYDWAGSYRQHIALFCRQLRETPGATVTT
jgi:fido (protein-threonine AMPylation protein)